MAVVAIAVFSVLWLPVIPLFGNQLFIYIQKPPAYVAPPILALFASGVFLPAVTADAAFAGLLLGVTFGLARFGVELAGVASGNLSLGGAFVSMNFLYFALANFALSLSAMVFLSKPREKQACKMQRMEKVTSSNSSSNRRSNSSSSGSSAHSAADADDDTFETADHDDDPTDGRRAQHDRLVWRRGLFSELMLRKSGQGGGELP